MSPEARLNSITLTIVVFIMISLLKWGLRYIQNIELSTTVYIMISTALTSVAIYLLIFRILNFFLQDWTWIKKRVFGNAYVEGTWTGFFIGRGGDTRYIIETFEQDLSTIQIRGQSYTEDGKPHAQWTTESTTLDSIRGRLIYSYSCDILSQKVTLQGIGVFDLIRKNKKMAPSSIRGYVADLNDGKRLSVHELKISDTVLPDADAFQAAKQFVKKHRASFK